MSTCWRHPESPPNIWKIIEGVKKLEDGTLIPVKFSIQEIPENRKKEALQHMFKYYILDQPILKSLDCKNDPNLSHDFAILWEYCLNQGITIAAYIIDENGEISELVGINILCVITNHTKGELLELRNKYISSRMIQLLNELSVLEKAADPCKILGVDKYITAFGLNVAPHYRGQKLGLQMLETRQEVGRKYNIPATSSTFSAIGSQILAARAGFKEMFSRKFSDMLDNDTGKPFLPNIESKELKLMMKLLY